MKIYSGEVARKMIRRVTAGSEAPDVWDIKEILKFAGEVREA